MSDSGMRFDPFEDTGDWPFREALPSRERRGDTDGAGESLFDSLGDTAVGTPGFEAPEGALDELAVEDLAIPSMEARAAFDDVDESAADGDDAAELSEDGADGSDPEPVAGADPVEAVAEEAVVEPVEGVVEEVVAEPAEDPAEPGPGMGIAEHAPGAFVVPDGPEVLEGGPHGFRRSVAVVVSRFNGDITSRMLELTLDELRACHVADDAVTVVPVPGAFELPVAALALAKTRRYACVVALGCVVRGETAHFDLVASEVRAASSSLPSRPGSRCRSA